MSGIIRILPNSNLIQFKWNTISGRGDFDISLNMFSISIFNMYYWVVCVFTIVSTYEVNLFIEIRLPVGAISWIIHSNGRVSIYSKINGAYTLFFCQFDAHRAAQQLTREHNFHRVIIKINFTNGWHFLALNFFVLCAKQFFTLLLRSFLRREKIA